MVLDDHHHQATRIIANLAMHTRRGASSRELVSAGAASSSRPASLGAIREVATVCCCQAKQNLRAVVTEKKYLVPRALLTTLAS